MATSDLEYSIKGGNIINVSIKGNSIPLIPLKKEEFENIVMKPLEIVAKYIDYSKFHIDFEDKKNEWADFEINLFLNESSIYQKTFFKIICQNKEISREKLLKEVTEKLGKKFVGNQLRGALAGISMRTKSYGNESLYESEEKRDKEWEHYYRINLKYKNRIQDWLDTHDS